MHVFVDGLDTRTGQWVDCTDKTTYGQPRLSKVKTISLLGEFVLFKSASGFFMLIFQISCRYSRLACQQTAMSVNKADMNC